MGAVIVLLNVDRVLLTLGWDSGTMTIVRVLVIALSVAIVGVLIARGRSSQGAAASGSA